MTNKKDNKNITKTDKNHKNSFLMMMAVCFLHNIKVMRITKTITKKQGKNAILLCFCYG